jgi:hypothetical protein
MARTNNTEQKFKRKQKVVVVNDLPGVPVGTVGKVYYEAGITWFRYHVAFENGVELSNVDGNDHVTVDEWEERLREARRAELRAEREARNANLVVTPGPRKSH